MLLSSSATAYLEWHCLGLLQFYRNIGADKKGVTQLGPVVLMTAKRKINWSLRVQHVKTGVGI
jgi:hypothetical protein